MTKLVAATAMIAASLLLCSCGEEDASSVRIKLNPDFSGTISTSSVVIPAVPAPGAPGAESVLSGATITSRGELVMSTGTFTALDQLKVADITFEYGGGPKAPFVKVTIPRGSAAQWPKALGIPDEALRVAAAKALVPDAKASNIGSIATLHLTVPDHCKIVSAGVRGRGRGLNTAADELNATITIPMAVARGEFGTEPLVWHITWDTVKPAGKE